jgi:chaperonin GroES
MPAKKPVAKKATQKSVTNNVSAIGIQPLANRVLVRPLSAEEMGNTTQSGIIIPDSAQEKPEQGTVIAVGPGKVDDGVRTPVEVSIGDRVLFSKYGYDSVKVKGEEYYVIAEEKILAIIT